MSGGRAATLTPSQMVHTGAFFANIHLEGEEGPLPAVVGLYKAEVGGIFLSPCGGTEH